MRSRKNNRVFQILCRIIVFIIIFAVLIIIFDSKVRPIIKRKVSDCAKTQATQILNKTLISELERLNISYEDFAHIVRREDTSISSIEVDAVNINKYKAQFALAVSKGLREIESFEFNIALGTLLGPEILLEVGPRIPFRVSSSGYVKTEIESEFSEAGINQTLHKIVLLVEINVCCYFPAYCVSLDIDTALPLAETIIIGDIPDYFRS